VTGEYLALLRCVDCRNGFMACPDCVNTIRIDPATGLPPDVEVIDGKAVHKEPDPEATARSVKQPVCDDCIRERNRTYDRGGEGVEHIYGYLETAEERHGRAHA
jgi:hypothetical protein